MAFPRLLALGVLAVLPLLGCSSGAREEKIPIGKIDPMNRVKATLQNYVNGQPMLSEVSSFDSMVAEVRQVYPDKAEILSQGLEELKTLKGNALASKSRELMEKLGLPVETKK
jgi:hypothetical protein